MKEKRKKIWLFLLGIVAIGILIYDTYNMHFSNHASTKKENLTIAYENAGNLLLSDIHEGSTTSLRITVQNESDEEKSYQIRFIEVYNELAKDFMITYDETGNIGKRYRRQDIAGTPFCITIDDETINNGTVTVRDRDSMKQAVIKIEELKDYLNEKIKF